MIAMKIQTSGVTWGRTTNDYRLFLEKVCVNSKKASMFILAGSDQIFQFECRRAQSFPESLQHIQKMALPMAKEHKKKDDFLKQPFLLIRKTLQ